MRLVFQGLVFVVIVWLCALASAQGDSETFRVPMAGTLPKPLQMSCAAAAGGRLYVFGGRNPDGWQKAVISAQYDDNAHLSGWRNEQEMPDFRGHCHNTIEVVGNHIYLLGGGVAARTSDASIDMQPAPSGIWTTINSDGTLQPWKYTKNFPSGGLHVMASCSNDHQVFVTGGHNGRECQDSVYKADLGADGEPGEWTLVGKLPGVLADHAATLVNGIMYVWCGVPKPADADKNTGLVYAAPVGADGQLGRWTEQAIMPQPIMAAVRAAFDNCLVTIGGRYKSNYPTNTIWFSMVPDGAVKQWNFRKTDLQARLFHSVAVDKQKRIVFVIGGRSQITTDWSSGQLLDTVQAFKL